MGKTSVRDGGAKVILFDRVSEFVTVSKRDEFCKAIINKLINFSFERIFNEKYDFYAKWSYQNLGKAHFGLSNYEAAIVNFNKVIEIDENYKFGYQEKGKTLFLLKKYQEAEDCFSMVIEIDPNYKWAYHASDY